MASSIFIIIIALIGAICMSKYVNKTNKKRSEEYAVCTSTSELKKYKYEIKIMGGEESIYLILNSDHDYKDVESLIQNCNDITIKKIGDKQFMQIKFTDDEIKIISIDNITRLECNRHE